MSALGSLVVKLALNHAEYVQGLDRSSQAALGFGQKTQRAFDQAERRASMFFKSAAAGAAGLVVGLLSLDKVKTTFLDFNRSLAEVSTLTTGTSIRMGELEAAAKRMAVMFGSQPVEQTRAFYQIISAGASTAAEATSILTAANRLAVGGVTDVATAADGLTSILNAYGDQVESAAAVSDTLFVGMRAGKTTIGELSAGLGKVTPLAAALNVSFDELVATVAALTKGGISTNESITGVRAVLAAVAKPTAEAVKLSNQLGIEFNAAAIEAKGFAGFIDEVRTKTGGSTDQLALLFGGVEALVPVMALAGQAGADFNQIMGDMAGKAGATQTAFDQMAASPGFKVDQMMAAISGAAITLGGILSGVVIPAATGFTEALNEITVAMDEGIAKSGTFGGVMAGIGETLNQFLLSTPGKILSNPLLTLFAQSREELKQSGEAFKQTAAATDEAAASTGAFTKTKADLVQATADLLKVFPAETNAINQNKKAFSEAANEAKQLEDRKKNFISSLTKEAAQLGRTSTELRKMEAATLGLSKQADPLIDEIDAQTTAARKLEAQLSKVKQITESVMTADERLAQTQAELNDLLGIKGGLSVETYNRALQQAQGQLDATDVKARQTFNAMDQYAISAARGMQSAFADFLFDPFDGGLGNLFKNFANTLHRMVAEIASSGLLRQAAGAFGLGASGSAFAGGGGFGLDISSIGSIASSTFSTGFGTTSLLGKGASLLGEAFGSAALSSFGSGLAGTAGLAGTGAGVFSAAGGAGTAFIGGAGTAIGGSGMGAAASLGSSFAAFAGPAAIAAVADIVFRQLAGDKTMGNFADNIPLVGSLGALLFGRGPLKQKETNLIGFGTASGFEGGHTSTKFKAQGGLFRSDKVIRQENPLTLELQTLLDSTLQGFGSSIKAFSDNIGLSTLALDDYVSVVNIASEKGKAITEQQITDLLETIGEDMAQQILPGFNGIRKAGEGAFAVLQRISTEFDALSNADNVLGLSLTDSRNTILGLSIEQRTAIVDAAGGAENLNNQIGFFATNFLSAEEQFNIAFASVDKQMGALGLSANMSRDEFKALVMSVTEVGGISVETAAALLNIQGPFLALKNAADQLGPAITSAAVEEEKRIRKMETAEATRLDNINTALGEVDSAFNVLQRSIDANKKTITDDYNTALAAQNVTIKQFADSVTKLTGLSGILKTTIDSINPLNLDAARSQIQAAIASKDLDAASLKAAIAVLSQSDSAGFTNKLDFQRSQAKNLSLLNDLNNVTDSQLTLEERTLTALEAARDRLTDGFKADITRLDGILGNARDQLDAMKGIDVSVLRVVDAVNNLQIKLSQATALQGVSSLQPQIDNARAVQANQDQAISLPTSSSGATVSPISDAQIRDFAATHTPQEIHTAARANGIDSSRLAAALGTSKTDILRIARENNLASFDVGGRVPKTGLALIHKNEQILTENDSNNLSAQVGKLRTAVEVLTVANNKMNRRFDKWDAEGTPPVRASA